eukprot:8091-Heterococcus_DN1.PRE.2
MPAAVAPLLAHTLALAATNSNSSSSSSNTSKAEAAVEEPLLLQALQSVGREWYEPSFVHSTPPQQQEYLTAFILAALNRCDTAVHNHYSSFIIMWCMHCTARQLSDSARLLQSFSAFLRKRSCTTAVRTTKLQRQPIVCVRSASLETQQLAAHTVVLLLVRGVGSRLEVSAKAQRLQGMRVGEALSRLVGQPVHFDELAAADAALATHTASTTAAAITAAATDSSPNSGATAATKQRRRRRKPQPQQQQPHLLDDIDPDAVLDLSAPVPIPQENSVEQSGEGSAGVWETDTSETESENDNSNDSSSKGLLQPYAVPDEGVSEGLDDDDRVEGNVRDGKVPLYLHQAIESKLPACSFIPKLSVVLQLVVLKRRDD